MQLGFLKNFAANLRLSSGRFGLARFCLLKTLGYSFFAIVETSSLLSSMDALWHDLALQLSLRGNLESDWWEIHRCTIVGWCNSHKGARGISPPQGRLSSSSRSVAFLSIPRVPEHAVFSQYYVSASGSFCCKSTQGIEFFKSSRRLSNEILTLSANASFVRNSDI